MYKERILCMMLVIIGACAQTPSTAVVKNVYNRGEHFDGAHFADDENALYWVDVAQNRIYRMDVDTENVTMRQIGYGPETFVVRIKDYPKLLVMGVRATLYLLPWNAEQSDAAMRLLSVLDMGLPDNRCDYGKVDAKGRLWFGTMGIDDNGVVLKDQGTLYITDEHSLASPTPRVRPVTVTRGIAWTADNKFMFYTDPSTRNIDVFDFDLESGTVTKRRTLFSFEANNVTGVPKGMTIDRDGNLWVGSYGGGQVIKIDSSTGELMEQHMLSTSMVTSVAWGGDNYSTLYVTTGRLGLNSTQREQEPEAGSLFSINLTGSRGYPENQFVFANADKY